MQHVSMDWFKFKGKSSPETDFPIKYGFPNKKTFKLYLTILKTIFTGNQLKISQQNQALECNINSRETSDEFPKIPRFDLWTWPSRDSGITQLENGGSFHYVNVDFPSKNGALPS